MKKSYIKFIVIAILILLFFYSMYLALSQKKPSSNTPPGSLTMTVPVSDGSIQIKDFTKNPVKVSGDNTVISQNDNFIISYYSSDQSFIITILAQPVQQNRNLAEQEFLTKLGIQETDACKLTVSLNVPAAVDESLAGQDYGLSFCPSGKAFPSK